MKPPLEQKFIAGKEFTKLGLEVKTKFYFPTDKQDTRQVPNYLVVGKGRERYILQRTIPLSVLEEICEKSAVYRVIDYYEVLE